MVKFEGKMGTLYQIFNGSGEVGSKAFWTMLKKTALFLHEGFPYPAVNNSKLNFLGTYESEIRLK